MPNHSDFSERLQVAMKRNGIKQVELCEKTGIHKSTMSQYLKGVFEPKRDRIAKIADVLNVEESWLSGYIGDPGIPMLRQTTPQVSAPLSDYSIGEKSEAEQSREMIENIVKEMEHLSKEKLSQLLNIAKGFRENQ